MDNKVPQHIIPFLDTLQNEGFGEFRFLDINGNVFYPLPLFTANETKISAEILLNNDQLTKIPVYDSEKKLVGFILRSRRDNEETRDYLTGLPDRRTLEIEFLKRKGYQSLAIIDLDRFKEINDSLGHRVGDTLLALFASALHKEIGVGEFLARYGGDEFILLLSESSSKVSIEKMNALRERTVKRFAQKIDTISEKIKLPAKWQGAFSFGWTPLRPDDSLANAFLRADRLLLKAKRSLEENHRGQNQ